MRWPERPAAAPRMSSFDDRLGRPPQRDVPGRFVHQLQLRPHLLGHMLRIQAVMDGLWPDQNDELGARPGVLVGSDRVADRRKVAENRQAVAAVLLAFDVDQPEAGEVLEYVQRFDIGLASDCGSSRVRIPPPSSCETLCSMGGKAVAECSVQLLQGSNLNGARTPARSPMPGTEPAAQ